MNRLFFVLNLFLLSSCITYNEANRPEDYIDRDYVQETKEREGASTESKPKAVATKTKTEVKYITREKIVKVPTGCRAMRMPPLRAVPALPKTAVLEAQKKGHAEMDKVLMNHIVNLRNVINANNAAMRAAVKAQNATCVK